MTPEELHPIAERVLVLQRQFADEVAGLSPDELKARGETLESPRQKALAQVAEEHSMPVPKLKRLLSDSKKREERLSKAATLSAIRRREAVEAYGLAVSFEWLDELSNLTDDGHRALWHIGQAARHLKCMAGSEWYPKGTMKLVRRRLVELEEAINDIVPIGICPYCKQIPKVMEECAPCFGKGVLLRGQEGNVPKKYFATELPVVLYRGGDHPMSAFYADDPRQLEMW